MKTIHKHRIERDMLGWTGSVLIETGADFKVLLVEAQRDEDELPTLWVECEPDEAALLRLSVVATGAQPPRGYRHIGSCVCRWGTLAWHVYMKAESEGGA